MSTLHSRMFTVSSKCGIIIWGVLTFFVLAACSDERVIGDSCVDSRSRPGVCKAIDQCSTAQGSLKGDAEPSICSYQGNQTIVCCLTEGNSSTSPPLTSPSKVPGERARFWCQKYSEQCTDNNAVGGGDHALPDEFPHMAAVGYGSENDIKWLCGGTLISERFILTAAQCLNSKSSGQPQWVLLGTVRLAPNETLLGETGQIHRIIRRIRHPGYSPPAKYDDVALLEIGPAITNNSRPLRGVGLHPACLNTNDTFTPATYISTGWGRTEYDADQSMELLKVSLDYIDEAKCNQTLNRLSRPGGQLGIDSSMMCAGILQSDRNNCQEVSGGPLQVPVRGGCQYDIWGIISFGPPCFFTRPLTVYPKISAYIEWIEENVWPEGVSS